MNDTIFPEQITAYRDNGFLVVENFLDADELDHWRQTTDEAVEQRLAAGRGFSNLNNQGDPDNYYAQVFTQAIKLADTHEGMRRIMLDPRLGRMAATLAGVEGVRIWHDQALYKPPFGNPRPGTWTTRTGRSVPATRSRCGSRSTTPRSPTAACGTCPAATKRRPLTTWASGRT
jgi:hypothetical protein